MAPSTSQSREVAYIGNWRVAIAEEPDFVLARFSNPRRQILRRATESNLLPHSLSRFLKPSLATSRRDFPSFPDKH